MQRRLRAWSQEQLAAEAGVDRRTIQRIEGGDTSPGSDTIRRVADALHVDIAELQLGLTEESFAALREAYLCPHCGAALESRTFVNHEYGDVEFEVFGCGHTRGWQHRPCPHDPAFPKLEDYELKVFEQGNGEYYCMAIGLTDSARAVELSGGTGRTPEDAQRWVKRSYIEAQQGSEAAEAAFPLFQVLAGAV